MSNRVRLVAGVLLGGLFLLYGGINVWATAELMRHSAVAGWLPGSQRGDVVRVGPVRPGPPVEDALRTGDELVAIDGAGVSPPFDLRGVLHGPPRPYRLLIRRDGTLRELVLHTVPYGLSVASAFLLAFLAVSLLFLLAGGALFLLRPLDQRANLLALAFALCSASGDTVFPLDRLPGWMLAVVGTSQALTVLLWPVLLHFFLVFPERSRLLERVPRLPLFLYAVPALLSPLAGYAFYLLTVEPGLGFAVFRASSPVVWLLRTLVLAYALAALAALVLNYRHASLVSRRKLRVVVAGTIAGFLPMLLVVGLSFVVDLGSLGLWAGRLMIFWVVLSLALVPLAFGYAIVRHQVIPVRLMIRRGVRYLLVSRGFYLVEAAVLLSMIAYLLTGSRAQALDRLGGRADILATVGIGLAVFGLLQLVNRRVMPAIDRRFFRDAYDAQRILARVGEAARQMGSIDELLGLAAARVEDALHPESMAVFLRDEASGHYACVFPPAPAPDRLSAQARVLESLQVSPRTRDTDLGGLVVPVLAKGDLLGMLSLGPRRGDLPYSRPDRRLLEAIAWQLAYAIENARLVRRMVEEERLRREIAMASEVQRRLFPARPPETRRLELAGLCHPAQGVGGDYYDFLELGDGKIGIAVADVAGKGISAALLMSVVQASLRSQAGSVPPCDLVASMNRLLYRSAARNRFATFFYAEFDEPTGRLTYVNAGHNPPLLLRAASSPENGPRRGSRGGNGGGGVAVAVAPAEAKLLSLKTGGLVIGAMPATTYEQAVVDLAPGDLLVAYTDGVTEAFDHAGEEFGEERLWEAVAASAHLPAAEMAEAIVSSVRGFCGDAPQYDDITLVAAKVR